MKFVIFRHGDKQSDFHRDSPLSPQGLEQAKNIARLVQSKKLPIPNKLFASTKLRTLQTLTPLAELCRLKVQSTPLLDLRSGTETSKDFRLRVQEFLVSFQLEPTPCLFICTHQDWVEEFLSVIESSSDLLAQKYTNWPPGQYMYFEKSEIWDLVEFKSV
jgi:phosphohistidine phosphatase SixA